MCHVYPIAFERVCDLRPQFICGVKSAVKVSKSYRIRLRISKRPLTFDARQLLPLWEAGNLRGRLKTGRRELPDVGEIVGSIVATHAADMEAIERVLGAPPHSFYRTDAEAVSVWVAALPGGQDDR
jgi:hypothetical protein